jgi:large subunit ribosomal protein L15
MPTKKKADAEAKAPERIGLHNLMPSPGSHRERKRLGRGPGSGTGKTSGKGHKGSKARTGHGGPGGGKPHFEGGQMPLTRRLPKRGFTPPFRVENQVVSLEDLSRVPAGTEITQESLASAGLIEDNKGPAKLLSNGELSGAVTVRGIKISAGARAKIEAAGGKIEGESGKRGNPPQAGGSGSGKREEATAKREASPKQKEASSKQKEASSKQKEGSPKQKEANAKQAEASPKQEEASPKQDEASPKQDEG